MRKGICLLFLFGMVLICSACAPSGRKQISVTGAGYSCLAEITYGDLKATALLEVSGGGIFRVTMREPESLADLTFSFDREQMSVSYGELQGATILTAQYGGFASLLNGVFLKLTSGQPLATRVGTVYQLNGTVTGSSFSVNCDPKGFPIKIEIPEAALCVVLTDWMELT